MRAGLIGAGLQGNRRAGVFKHCDDNLMCVADVNVDKARQLANDLGCVATADWEEVIARDDIDAVIVATPPHLHLPMCAAALRRGKHVLCEKPLARNPEEAARIVAIARENDLRLDSGFNLRHHPGVRQVRTWVAEGEVGEPHFLRVRYGTGGRPGLDKEWRADRETSGGGQLMDQGVHAIDLSRWFLGDFSEATGFVSTGFWDISPLEDNAFALLRTPTGRISSIHVSWMQWTNLFSLEIYGRDGHAAVEGLGGSYGVERATLAKKAFLEPFAERAVQFRGGDVSWEHEWLEFTSAVKEDREPLGNGEDGLQAVRLAHAVYESAAIGAVIRV